MGNAEPVDQYLRTFAWNKVKYRADKSLKELIDLLQRVSLVCLVGLSVCLTVRTGSGEYR